MGPFLTLFVALLGVLIMPLSTPASDEYHDMVVRARSLLIDNYVETDTFRGTTQYTGSQPFLESSTSLLAIFANAKVESKTARSEFVSLLSNQWSNGEYCSNS